MHLMLRAVLVWLIAVALPMQGIASATAVHCGAHNGSARGPSVYKEMSAHDMHAHHGHAAGSMETIAMADDSADAIPDAADVSVSGCSACASCCAAATLSNFSYVPSKVIFDHLRPSDVSSARGFISDGPYHPPRSIIV